MNNCQMFDLRTFWFVVKASLQFIYDENDEIGDTRNIV